MKKLLTLLLLGVFMLSFTSALEWDNKGYYDEETKTITIKNALGLGDTIGGAKLNTPQNYNLPVGYQKVAEFDLWANEDYNDVLKNLNFYNKNFDDWDKHKFIRDFDIKYERIRTIQEPTYSENCYWNITNQIETCKMVQNGEVDKEIKEWVKITPADLKKNDRLTIGIFTDVKIGDNIEWILEIYGVEVTQWASFVQSSGTTTIDGNYTVQTFTSNGTFNLTGDDLNVSILVIGGGGGGGGRGGGGGAGGYIYNSSYFIAEGNYTITIGEGGSGGAGGDFGINGGNSTFDTITSVGGGAGGGSADNGFDGGSGGGGGVSGAVQTGGSATAGQGNNGGNNIDSANYGAGGGGGAGAVGQQGAGAKGGNGGAGLSNSINGTSVTRAGGGGGGMDSTGGVGIGGAGGGGSGSLNPTAGVSNTGGGGGGKTGTEGVAAVGGSGIIIIRYLTPSLPSVTTTLISPANTTQTTNQSINFTFQSIPFEANLTNATLNIWNATSGILLISNFTTLSGSESINTSFQNNLTQGNYLWGAISYGTNDTNGTSSNRTLTIHTTIPDVTIHDPQPLINYQLLGENLTLNWTVGETGENLTTHITNCTYEYNGTVIVLNNTVCTQINQTSFEYVLGVNNLTFNVTDFLGLVNSTTIEWNIKLTEINQTYNNETTEGNLETFLASIRLGSGYSITDAVLFSYNGTSSTGQSFADGNNTVLRKADFLIPNVPTDTNITFYWDITLSDSTNLNLSFQNQTILNLDLDNCSTFTNELLNMTVVDEEDQTILPSATIEIAVNIYDMSRTVLILNHSDIYENINPLRICLNINVTNTSMYSMDTTIKYEEEEHAKEYYNIVNSTITEGTESQIITLYDLNLNESTEFQLSFTGADFLPVENALINVDRQYISENTFKTVELPKTDYNGQSVLHLVRNDVIYNIRISKSGIVLGNFENLVAFCDDFTIGDCNIELNAFDSVESVFDYDTDLGIVYQAPTYSAVEDKVSFNFVTSDGSAKEVILEVTRNDIFGNRSICNSSITSSGGTLSCDIDPNLDESTLNTQVYVNDILSVKTSVVLESTNYGVGGYLIMFVLALSFVLIFSGSKTGVLFSIGLTLIVSIGLGLSSGEVIGIGASGLWLLIIIIIGIYKLNKDIPA